MVLLRSGASTGWLAGAQECWTPGHIGSVLAVDDAGCFFRSAHRSCPLLVGAGSQQQRSRDCHKRRACAVPSACSGLTTLA